MATHKVSKLICVCGQKSVHGSVFCTSCLAKVQAYNMAVTKRNNSSQMARI